MKIYKAIVRSGIFGSVLSTIALALPARAQQCGEPPLYIPCSGDLGTTGLSESNIGETILSVITIGLGVAGSVAVLFLIVGGFLYITAAGDEQRLEKAKTTLKNAIIGTVFILLALVIVITIQQFLSV